jgi:hypothetical protein
VIERTPSGLYAGLIGEVALPERHAPPIADLPPLRGVSCCAACRDGLPPAQRCTRDEDRRKLATLPMAELETVSCCPLDLRDELELRRRTGGQRNARWALVPEGYEVRPVRRSLLERLRRRKHGT